MQQTGTKGIQKRARPGGEGDPLGIVQEIKIWPYYQMVYTENRIHPRNENHKLLDFEIQTDHRILTRKPDVVLINKKKKTCQLTDFAVLSDHSVRIKAKREKNTWTLLEN